MSRSYKRNYETCVINDSHSSNKADRTRANKALRRQNKMKIASYHGHAYYLELDSELLRYGIISLILHSQIDEDACFKVLREVSDPWCFKTDGLARYQGSNYIRK